MIERDYSFMQQLNHGDRYRNNNIVLIEVSDRCNVDCPHCYHIPDNSIPDRSIQDIIEQVKKFYKPGMDVCLTGAEASLRKDFPELITELYKNFDGITVSTLTNGIRFANKDFLKKCVDAGLTGIRVGLNHPSYLDNATVRDKQVKSIYNLKDLGVLGYVGYTMASISELEDILEETTNSDWAPIMYRIRYGSDIGRYPDQERMYVSDICKITKAWCERNGKTFSIINDADNNSYHVMVSIDGILYRLIQWCDETDINMEELRCGPWNDFVTGKPVTNFLHQVIQRDVWKNKQITLTDTVPKRYQLGYQNDDSPLNFKDL